MKSWASKEELNLSSSTGRVCGVSPFDLKHEKFLYHFLCVGVYSKLSGLAMLLFEFISGLNYYFSSWKCYTQLHYFPETKKKLNKFLEFSVIPSKFLNLSFTIILILKHMLILPIKSCIFFFNFGLIYLPNSTFKNLFGIS